MNLLIIQLLTINDFAFITNGKKLYLIRSSRETMFYRGNSTAGVDERRIRSNGKFGGIFSLKWAKAADDSRVPLT